MPDDGTNRIFIIEQGGTIRIYPGRFTAPSAVHGLSHPKLNPAGKKSYLGWCFMRISVRTPILRTSTDNYPSGWRQGSSYFPERRYRPVSVWRTIHSQI